MGHIAIAIIWRGLGLPCRVEVNDQRPGLGEHRGASEHALLDHVVSAIVGAGGVGCGGGHGPERGCSRARGLLAVTECGEG
jgi:hypothetical protein